MGWGGAGRRAGKGSRGSWQGGGAARSSVHSSQGRWGAASGADRQAWASSTTACRGTGRGGAAAATRDDAYARGEALAAGRPVWNFAYGANINPWKLETKRGIKPLEQAPGVLDGWRLLFNHRGGFGNVEPLAAEGHGPGPDGVHGMLLLLGPADFATLCSMEHQYDPTRVQVRAYDGRVIDAVAFVSMPAFRTLAQDLAAPERYMKLLRDGAQSSKLDPQYAAWLRGMPSNNGERGPEYYQVEGQRGTSPSAQARATAPRSGSPGAPGRDRRSGSPRRGGSLGAPTGIYATADSIFVADSKGDRVLRLPRPQVVGGAVESLGAQSGGEVVAGGRGRGSALDQLNRPFRLFVDESGATYVVDRNNARVVRWDRGAREGVVVAGGNGAGSALHQLDQPSGVFLHHGDVYVSDRANHRVVRWEPGAKEGVVVAGGRGSGCKAHQLACPAALVVTADGVVVVADEANDRVQAWWPGCSEGVTVAGGGPPGGGSGELYHPLGLCMSSVGSAAPALLIADSLNYRVQRSPLALSDDDRADLAAFGYSGETVAGGRGMGRGPEQLGQPISVCLDEGGVLYVADSDNGRVQVVPPAAQLACAGRSVPASTLRDGEKDVRTGAVVEYRVGPGFGFVEAGGKRYFAHHSDIREEVQRGYAALRKGDRVEFLPRRDEKWGQRAAWIRRVA